MDIFLDYIKNDLGYLVIRGGIDKIMSVSFEDSEPEMGETNKVVEECKSQLLEYFSGSRKVFSVPLDIQGTDFQKDVWQELIKIPFGEVITYTALAQRLGGVKKLRAVGMANSKNPVGIIVPCHRVIGKNGNLVGYGGGLWRKRWLLEFESRRLNLFQTEI